MPPTGPILLKLDRERPYELRWTRRAEARMASLARPVSFTDITKRKRGAYAICAVLWSALVERDHSFDAPEDLADHIGTEEQQLAAIRAINAMIAEAFPEKKSLPKNEPSATGPSESSSSVSPPVSTPGA